MSPEALAKLAREKLEQWDKVEYVLPNGSRAVWERPAAGRCWLSLRRWLSVQPEGGEVLTYASGQLRRRCTLTPETMMNAKDLYEIGKTLGELQGRVARLEKLLEAGPTAGSVNSGSAAKEPSMADLAKMLTALAKGDFAAVAATQGGELGELGELASLFGKEEKR